MSDQSPLQTALAPLRALWSSRGPRERQMLSLLAVFLMATLLWAVAIAPLGIQSIANEVCRFRRAVAARKAGR